MSRPRPQQCEPLRRRSDATADTSPQRVDETRKGRRVTEDQAELARLRALLQQAADDNLGAPSSHCCPNCPWCDGEGWQPFEHAANCPVYDADNKVRLNAPSVPPS